MSIGILEIVLIAVSLAAAVLAHVLIRNLIKDKNKVLSTHAILVYGIPLLLTGAAALTPPDPISMLLYGIPLTLFYGVFAVLLVIIRHRSAS